MDACEKLNVGLGRTSLGDVGLGRTSLGACLGGNLPIVGASANIVVANLATRYGHPINFMQFFRYGSSVVIASLVISRAYLWVCYLG